MTVALSRISRSSHRRRSASGAWRRSHPRRHIQSKATKTGGVANSPGLLVQKVEARHKLLVEAGDLAVEDEGRGGQSADCLGDLGEATGVVAAGPAHQPDAGAVLVGDDAPAVDLLLEDPAVAMGSSFARCATRPSSPRSRSGHPRRIIVSPTYDAGSGSVRE